ncbi:hypothetical protein G6F66_007166 [Rhizopus arrhizus]|nr:hypothetical protein G6F66_007166 [Rhizopus arrhizus]
MILHNTSKDGVIIDSDTKLMDASDEDEEIYTTAPNSPTTHTTTVTSEPQVSLGINDRFNAFKVSNKPSKTLDTYKTVSERGLFKHKLTKPVSHKSIPCYRDQSDLRFRIIDGPCPFYEKGKKKTFEVYTYDYTHVDHLNISENEFYEPFTDQWLKLKRDEYFKNLRLRLDDFCIECETPITIQCKGQILRAEIIKRRKRGPICMLCYKLIGSASTLNEEIEILEYLLNGNLSPKEEIPQGLTPETILNMFYSRTRQIKKRSSRVKSDISSAGCVELLMLVNKSSMRCAVTNSKIFLSLPSEHMRYWALTFDHILPLSIASERYSDGSHVDNLQVMCTLMNNVKGDCLNQPFLNWWARFKQAKLNGFFKL